MHTALRIPEIAQRDRFLKRVVAQRCAFTVRTPDTGLVSVVSPRSNGKPIVLFWSAEIEAQRWAPLLRDDARVWPCPLDEILTTLLAELRALGAIAGPDWTADPIEAEVEADDLVDRLRAEILLSFLTRVRSTGGVWVLDTGAGPVRTASPLNPADSILPCWSDAALAEQSAAGDWAGLKPKLMPLESFTTVALPWLGENGWRVSPEHSWTFDVLEISADELAARLSKR